MFIKRLFSTILLLAIFSCIIFGNEIVSKISFVIFGSFISFFTPYEAGNMLKQCGKPIFTKTASFFILLSFLTCFLYYEFNEILYIIFGLSFIFAVPWILLLFIIGKEKGLEQVLNTAGLFLLFVPPLLIITYIYSDISRLFFLYLVLGTKIGDIGAYVTGTVTNKLMKGNHKMVPSISPGKSWEGAVGGLLISILFSVFMYFFAFSEYYNIWFSIIFGIVLFVFGAAGDLAESCFKRSCGVKDSGHTIPGIGGVFDLTDSLFLNAVVFLCIANIIGI